MAQAAAVLEKAIEQIDAEIEEGGTRAAEARAEYEALKASAAERTKAIQAKIKALRS